ncbi:hypothetical protein FOZ60_005586 [Perkinsus olseni]|uniref:RNase H type-1 domain-containing protein n=1 Tax=Perkinsus olseni TaxID=32597 RepID=A0A7J6NT32_PEROL|nr:hypothetical protein FOZ60_005586 [Perkinsus olseni]
MGKRPEAYECWELPRDSTVFQSEVLAIGRACEVELARLRRPPSALDTGDIEIISDCLSALRCVAGDVGRVTATAANSRSLVLELHQELAARNRRLCLRWIRSHQGNVGNTIADTTARLGATMGDCHPCPVPITAALERLSRKHETGSMLEWQRLKGHFKGYNESRVNLGQQQRKILSKFTDGRDRRRLFTVISGHGDVRTHLKHTKPELIREVGIKCRHCNEEEESVGHLVFRCGRFRQQRQWMRSRMGGAFPQRISVFLEDPRKARLLTWLLRKIWPNEGRDLAKQYHA